MEKSSQFGVYIHIPYCLQRCSYCDFATYAVGENPNLPAPEIYVDLVREEMRQRLSSFQNRELSTIYFGGGTPSLLQASLIVSLIDELANCGLKKSTTTEITIEINPATIDAAKLETYMAAGVNRFSVGAQTFDEKLLKKVKREHSAKQTRETLALLQTSTSNFSADILFALPGQSLEMLDYDLQEVLQYGPSHISPYCLTIPESHVLTPGRPPEDEQVEMFALIKKILADNGFSRYEISNFAKPNFESKHNSLYWLDQDYVGLGLSAHSYLSKHPGRWGARFWNPKSISEYIENIGKHRDQRYDDILSALLPSDKEVLELHQSLTDFCHTSLRLFQGLQRTRLETKFGTQIARLVGSQCEELSDRGWLEKTPEGFRLTDEGTLLSNQVFAELTYVKSDRLGALTFP